MLKVSFFTVALGFVICFISPAYGENIGVLLASHGDIDSVEQLEQYLKNATRHMAPVPRILRGITAELSWPALKMKYEPEYRAFGFHTHYRENSLKQAMALGEKLGERGVTAQVYTGFNLISPSIAEALKQMQADDVTKIVVVNQGAQYSMATRMNYHDIREYLASNPDYKPAIIGVNQYGDDRRFLDALQQNVQADLDRYFAGMTEGDTCVLLAFHGLPIINVWRGDRATKNMLQSFAKLAGQMPEIRMFYGFLNENLPPGIPWTKPSVIEAAHRMGEAGCQNILLDARISFTIHSRIVLYDLNIKARQEILKKNPLANIILARNFDDDPIFADFMAQLILEALDGHGDIEHLTHEHTGNHPESLLRSP